MSVSQGAESGKAVRIKRPAGPLLVLWPALIAVLNVAFRQAGLRIQIDGAEAARTGAGGEVQFKVNGGAGPSFNDHNFTPKFVDSTHLTISPGEICGGYPTIGGTSIADSTPPQLTVSATDLQFVYCKVVYSLSFDASGYLTPGGSSVTSRVISAETALKTNTDTDRWFLLFKWQAGKLVDQIRFYSFDQEVKDDGTSSSKPTYRSWISG